MNKKYILFSLIFLIILSGFFFYHSNADEKDNDSETQINIGVNPGEMAPDFTLAKINGDLVNLSDFRGQKVFLNFWASWCPPCIAEMPDIQKLYRDNTEITVLTINVQESKRQVSNFMIANNYNFPVVLDEDGRTSARYLVRGIPTTLAIDKNGIIINRKSGILSYQEMLDFMKIE
ncbi:TlpA family protein disulfide reductase [Natronospora cellulosivora (SeqCode)]